MEQRSARLPVTQEVVASNPIGDASNGAVRKPVKRRSSNLRDMSVGSTPSRATFMTAKWWNRWTRDSQKIVPTAACEFNSRLGYFQKQHCRCDRCPTVIVKEDLRKPHRVVDQARTRLRAETGDQKGLLHTGCESGLNICVTKKSLNRALRILDALILHWESIGGAVRSGKTGARFCRDEDGVAVSISEQIRRHEKPNKGRYYFKEYTYEATGKLTLTITGRGDGLRRNWSDGKLQRLESVLGNVAVNLEKWIVQVREHRLDAECESRQKSAAEKCREARKDVDKRESERIESLSSCVDAYVRATNIRTYLSALDTKIAAEQVKPNDPERFPVWREWAQWYADSVCPITPTPPRPEIDELVVRTNRQLKDVELTSKARLAFERGEISDTDELASLTREDLNERCGGRYWGLFSEATRILEGLGYDISNRSRW